MRKLYEVEYEYREVYDNALYAIEEGCTLEEFLELGFNNATLLNPNEEDTDRYDIFDLYDTSDIADKLTNEMLQARVSLSSTYQDGDDYTCANIVLENEEDWKLFEKLVEEDK